jgi:acetylornithine deacetylase/succinyl-diaminopimelate desuccinylase-like protein
VSHGVDGITRLAFPPRLTPNLLHSPTMEPIVRATLSLALLALFATTSVSAQEPDFDAAGAEAVELLQGMVRIDSSSPPGNETKVAEYIRDILAAEGIESDIYEMEPGRGNLVARIRGNGSKRPVLLMGHIDVVGVERDQWSVDPFAGLIKDGYLWGRGSQDDKGMSAAELQVFLMIARSGVELDRDVIFMANAGEEGSPHLGVEFMIAEHFDEIDAEFGVNEGGGMTLVGDEVTRVDIATTEKNATRMKLIARGSSGHGSRPRPDNPIIALGRALAKFDSWQPPMRLNATTREYFRRMAEISSPETAFLYRNLENPAITDMVQEQLRLTDIAANSALRTSISPTIVEGGFRYNVIPAEAIATLDIRALPDEDTLWLKAEIERVIDDPAVEVVRWGKRRPTSDPVPIDSDFFLAMERVQAEMFPSAVTIPTMLTAGTDGAQLRAKGVHIYGVGLPTDAATGTRWHGNDERTPVVGVGLFVEFLYKTVMDVSGG